MPGGRDVFAHSGGKEDIVSIHSSDPRLYGVLLVIQREGETADPHLEAVAVARDLAWRDANGMLHLTAAGRAITREQEARRQVRDRDVLEALRQQILLTARDSDQGLTEGKGP